MKWTPEAEAAIKKVPFFVRKRVRTRVESEAQAEGKPLIALAEVKATQKRYLNNMSAEIKGYRLETCFGANGCPNRACGGEALYQTLEQVLEQADLLTFLKSRVEGSLKFHHEFTVTLAECPNACSQPQIRDVAVIGAACPRRTAHECTACGECVDACPDDALTLRDEEPIIDADRCLYCGKCTAACPTGALATGMTGFRVLLGGKLGRRPRLAMPLPGIFTKNEVTAIVKACLDFYKERSLKGERFAALLDAEDFNDFVQRFGKENSLASLPGN